ncbi:FliM/FliN family flagellar motor switch protein [Aliiroseovarius sp. S1339]|uniref:FliM/FliN family flagellar motor switch protein n=1 Tax=Aliiroseovarius sp. S1339 TaxID=2936990 RepID=UPI0020BF05F5|nr:flagellar motor switch protein FliM [Aliiroseovarius sp. S1339]MCK8462854.1 FliM/FliN family flagellar motor switch protein [Aliiroseovarius sp. S1339]
MADPEKISAIRQKAGARRLPPEIAPVTAAGALGTALARAGEATAGLVITASDVAEDRTVLSALEGQISDHDLLALVEGPDSRFGMLVADPNLIAALIEMQTVGRVLPAPAQPRPATRTDATMCADFFDRVLEVLEAELTAAHPPVAPLISGYCFAVRLEDYRAASMVLPDIPYRRFQTTLDLGEGGKQGALSLLLPFAATGRNGQTTATPATAGGSDTPGIVLGARAELHAVLHRVSMSLDEVTALAPGMTVIVPREALSTVALEDMKGQVLSTCRLGQAKGQRALRIGTELPDDSMSSQAQGLSHSADPAPALSKANGPTPADNAQHVTATQEPV